MVVTVRSANKARQQTNWTVVNNSQHAYNLFLDVVDKKIEHAAKQGYRSTTITVNHSYLRPLLLNKQLRTDVVNYLASIGYHASWYPDNVVSTDINGAVQHLTVDWDLYDCVDK